jgi:hypothetical protein
MEYIPAARDLHSMKYCPPKTKRGLGVSPPFHGHHSGRRYNSVSSRCFRGAAPEDVHLLCSTKALAHDRKSNEGSTDSTVDPNGRTGFNRHAFWLTFQRDLFEQHKVRKCLDTREMDRISCSGSPSSTWRASSVGSCSMFMMSANVELRSVGRKMAIFRHHLTQLLAFHRPPSIQCLGRSSPC